MKKITRKETKVYLTGVELTGKEFTKLLMDANEEGWDLQEWILPLKDKDGESITANNTDKITIEGTVTIMFREDDFDELPIIG
jgi:hypothetical protein